MTVNIKTLKFLVFIQQTVSCVAKNREARWLLLIRIQTMTRGVTVIKLELTKIFTYIYSILLLVKERHCTTGVTKKMTI
jgi:hypothetical protein